MKKLEVTVSTDTLLLLTKILTPLPKFMLNTQDVSATINYLAVFINFVLIACPEQQAGTAPWVIAISIIIPLLVLGILLIILLKTLLLLSVWYPFSRIITIIVEI